MSACGYGHEVSPCFHVDTDTECLHVYMWIETQSVSMSPCVFPCLHVDMDMECLHVDTDTEGIMSYMEISMWIWIVTWRSPCGYAQGVYLVIWRSLCDLLL